MIFAKQNMCNTLKGIFIQTSKPNYFSFNILLPLMSST